MEPSSSGGTRANALQLVRPGISDYSLCAPEDDRRLAKLVSRKPAEDAADAEAPNRSGVEVAAQHSHCVLSPVVCVPRPEAGARCCHKRARPMLSQARALDVRTSPQLRTLPAGTSRWRRLPFPILVLPGDDEFHPRATAVELAELAPRSEVFDPWRNDKRETAEVVRRYLKEAFVSMPEPH